MPTPKKKEDDLKPWEMAAQAEEEGSSPWDDYVSSYTEQKELERSMPTTMADAGYLAANGASHDWLDEINGIKEAVLGGQYKEGRNSMRERVGEARDNLGFAGDVIETGGNVLSTLAIPEGRAGKALTEIGLAAFQGAGSADEMEDIPEDAAKSATVSGVVQAATKGTGKMLGMDDPAKKLAKVSGARGQDFKKKGIGGWGPKEFKKSPDVVAKRMDEIGLYKQGRVRFDTAKGKFVPEGGKLELETYFKPQSLDDLHNRALEAVSTIKDENIKLLQGKSIPMSKVAEAMKQTVEDYIPDGFDYAKRSQTAQNIVDTMLNDLNMQGKIKRTNIFGNGTIPPLKQGERLVGNNMTVDAADVEKMKKSLYDEVQATFGQGKSANDLNLGPEFQRKFAKNIDSLVDQYGGEAYRKNNDIMSDLLQTSETMFEKGAREAGYGAEGPRLTMGSQLLNGIKDMTINNAPVGVGMARMGQIPDRGLMGAGARNFVERLPVEHMNNRKPQSVPNIPEELIRTPLPRTTQGLMQNKNFVLAKVAQMAPEMFEGIKDVYDHDPERLSELAPVIAAKMPHFFERDKYNRFDGRIMSEQDKQRAIKDTLSNPKLNSIQQAQIITKLNKDGLYDG